MSISESLQRESQTGDLVCEFSTQRNQSAEQLSAELPSDYSDRHGSATLMLSVAHNL